jgi:GH24 family phage-related lysozyme (muramidase)
VVREGGADEPTAQLSPGMTQEQASHQRQRTEQLLDATENNLRQLAGRSLNQNQQDTIAQIHNYMAGARSALKDGDPQRARTLAFKARLLSDELAKH